MPTGTTRQYTPDRIQRFVASRFVPVLNSAKDKAPFDLIRATVNLTVASILISIGYFVASCRSRRPM